MKDISGLNVWKQAQNVLEQQALEELRIFNKNKTRKLAESSPNLEDENRKGTQILDINQYIKRQEQLKRDKQHKIALQKKAQHENVAHKVSLKHSKKETGHSSLPTNREKPVHDDPDTQSDNGSEYFPSDHDDADADYEHEGDYVREKVNTAKRKREINAVVKVIDDGLLSSYKKRLEKYYTQMEEEIRADDDHMNGAREDVEIADKLRIDPKMWGNLYR